MLILEENIDPGPLELSHGGFPHLKQIQSFLNGIRRHLQSEMSKPGAHCWEGCIPLPTQSPKEKVCSDKKLCSDKIHFTWCKSQPLWSHTSRALQILHSSSKALKPQLMGSTSLCCSSTWECRRKAPLLSSTAWNLTEFQLQIVV